MRFILTAGPCSDYDSALALLEGLPAEAVLADKGYDADYLVEAIRQKGAKVVIPPRSHRKTQRRFDRKLYQERNRIERMFNYLKHFRRISTRYDKTALSFLSFVHLAGIYLWLK